MNCINMLKIVKKCIKALITKNKKESGKIECDIKIIWFKIKKCHN